ncbi:hypothetical protein CL634_07045, partial [bacterium]|nr:hypothetical protein [bacterium]
RLLKQYLINALNKSFKFYSNKTNDEYVRSPSSPSSPARSNVVRSPEPATKKEEDDDSFDW